jgi:hypothetical protein
VNQLTSLSGTQSATDLQDYAGAFEMAGLTDGPAGTARFRAPSGMASDGEYLYVVDNDWRNNAVRRISRSTGAVTTVADYAGVTTGLLYYPSAIVFDGTDLYVLNKGANRTIAKVALNGTVSAVADLGTSSESGLSGSLGLACDADYFYVAADQKHQILRVSRADSSVGVLSGSGSSGYADGESGTAQFNYPVSLVKDGEYLYVADRYKQGCEASLRRYGGGEHGVSGNLELGIFLSLDFVDGGGRDLRAFEGSFGCVRRAVERRIAEPDRRLADDRHGGYGELGRIGLGRPLPQSPGPPLRRRHAVRRGHLQPAYQKNSVAKRFVQYRAAAGSS